MNVRDADRAQKIFACLTIVASVVNSAMADVAWAAPLQRGSIEIAEDGTVVFDMGDGVRCAFRPRFVILHSTTDPKLAARPGQLGRVKYNVASWLAARGTGGGLANEDTSVTAGDGHDERILRGDTGRRTADYFSAASPIEWIAVGVNVKERTVEWQFAPSELGELSATVELSDQGWPALTTRFKATKPGFYSLGYAGAPESDVKLAEEIWQPLIWQGRRIPDRSYLTLAYRCTLPAPMVHRDDVTTAVVVDPRVFPFQPLPDASSSQFGVAARNERGRMQSLVFAPVLGGAGSRMRAGETRRFRLRLFAQRGDTTVAFERIAREIYGFKDYRTNAVGSLNAALENIIAYGMSPYAQFNEDLRGCSYATDVPGAVKNVSSLHPLSAALVTDNPEIYDRRVRPIIEYMLSREKFLFAVSPEIKIQSPSWRLKGPCAPTSELATLYRVTGEGNPYLLDMAREMLGKTRMLNLDTPSPARRWDKVLAVATAARDKELLAEAINRADAYLEHECVTGADDFQKQHASFWDQLVPQFPELLTLYETTNDKRYLDAAHAAARSYAQFLWVCPSIPAEEVLVNPGGKAPHYWYLRSKGHPQMSAAPERVDAWRLSEIGLAPEGPATSTGHRGVFLATHAPWMMRIGALTSDQFLHDLARSAVIGRYRNFPGYHMNTARTTVYESADYPLRDHRELSYNSFHYNHIWPHAAMLIDYLVSDAFARSGGQIEFPSHFAEGYAYLKGKIYGDRPGRFYDDEGVWLWMPSKLLEIDNDQLNYVTGRKGDSLYIALANQSFVSQTAAIKFNRDFVRLGDTAALRRWVDNVPNEPGRIGNDGSLSVEVPAEGLVAIALSGVDLSPRRLPPTVAPLPGQSSGGTRFVELPFAEKTTGLILQYGQRKSAYVYLQATDETVESATLHYRTSASSASWQEVVDASYPFEYTVRLSQGDDHFEFFVTTIAADGAASRSEVAHLESN